MKPRRKAVLIGTVLGMLPAAIALVPFSLAWWYVHSSIGWNWNVIENLKWMPLYIVLWFASWRGVNVAASLYLKRRS